MNLNQLYQLRINLLQNSNKVVNKNTVLAVLDSHIQAITLTSGQTQQEDVETPSGGLQRVETMQRIKQTRHPPSREEVRKAYGH